MIMDRNSKLVFSVFLTILVCTATIPIVSASVTAQAPLLITSDFTFTGDLDVPLVVAADNVIIDGAGFALLGPDAGNNPNIYLVGIDISGRHKVTVKNVFIQGWDVGVVVHDSIKCDIQDNTIMFCHIGMVISWGEKNKISGNTANSNGWVGFQIKCTNKNSLVKNTANDNHWAGFNFEDATKNRIKENTAIGNNVGQQYPQWGNGFQMAGSSSGNNFIGNFASSNGRGFWLSEGTFDNNLVKNTAKDEFDGIHLFKTTNTWVKENTIINTDIYLAGASGNFLLGNTVEGIPNYEGCIYIDQSHSNIISDNHIRHAVQGFVIIRSDNNQLIGNTAADISERGFRITLSEGNILDGNIAKDCGWEGFYVGTLQGPYYPDTSQNNILIGNTAENTDIGFRARIGTYSNDYLGNTAYQNRLGFLVTSTTNNLFEGNIVTYNTQNGFHISDITDCVFRDNTITHHSNHGFWIGSANLNEFDGNTISNNHRGLEFADYADSNTVYNNDFMDNDWSVVFIQYTVNNWVYHNNFYGDPIRILYYDDPIFNNYLCNPDFAEGNYWSDYLGLDDGSNGRIIGDGIGDTNIPWHYDPFPLMDPV